MKKKNLLANSLTFSIITDNYNFNKILYCGLISMAYDKRNTIISK